MDCYAFTCMLNKAKELEAECPGSVAFLNFDGFDFDDVVQIMPSPVSLICGIEFYL